MALLLFLWWQNRKGLCKKWSILISIEKALIKMSWHITYSYSEQLGYLILYYISWNFNSRQQLKVLSYRDLLYSINKVLLFNLQVLNLDQNNLENPNIEL